MKEIDQQRNTEIVDLELSILQDLTVNMAILQTSTILFTLILALGAVSVTSTQEVVSIPPVVIAGDDVGECPSDEHRQDALQLIKSKSEQVVFQNYIVSPNCGPGQWRQVYYLNISIQNQSCPSGWNLQTVSSVSGCAGAAVSCRSAYIDVMGYEYSKVCGRLIGVGGGHPDAFRRGIPDQTTVEDNYLDGVSVTHGAPGSRTHIWSFGAGHPGRCPCDNSDRYHAPLPPSEVGENYFCSTTYSGDRLWTGTNCTSDNPCCSFHNPPYFSVQLPSPTTDQIELRTCTDEDVNSDGVVVLFAEIYIE